MPKLRLGQPFWLDRTAGQQPLRFPRHQQHIDVDVVIVGGGVTGAIAAYVFAEAGISVALLEAKRIGRGSTAASTALLMQEPDKDFRELANTYGKKNARRIWQIVGRATTDLISLIRAPEDSLRPSLRRFNLLHRGSGRSFQPLEGVRIPSSGRIAWTLALPSRRCNAHRDQGRGGYSHHSKCPGRSLPHMPRLHRSCGPQRCPRVRVLGRAADTRQVR